MSDSQREPHAPIADRKPGRSFSDPSRPLGEDVIARGDPNGGDPEGGVYGRNDHNARVGHGVPERAKCVAVLRKAEELMASGNPSGDTAKGRRRALELAAGRVGMTIGEYDRLSNGDEEIKALEAEVMDAVVRAATKM